MGLGDMDQIKVLLLEGNQSDGYLIKSNLESFGYDVINVSNEKHLLRLNVVERPDIIIVNPAVLGCDPAGVVRSIRQEVLKKHVPVLFVVDDDGHESIVTHFSHGADDLIFKPVDSEVLKGKLIAIERLLYLQSKLLSQNKRLENSFARVQRELGFAQHLFAAVSHEAELDSEFLNVWSKPVRTINSDVVLCRHTPSKDVHLMVCDFSAHGLSAALGAVLVAEIFYAMTDKGYMIDEIITELNKKLYSLLMVDMFCSATFVSVDAERTVMRVWNGGMPDVVVTDGRDIVARITSSKLALGVVNNQAFDFKPDVLPISESQRVYVATNGLFHGGVSSGIGFGFNRYEAMMRSNNGTERFDKIVAMAESFSEGANQIDDMSFVELVLNRELDQGLSIQLDEPLKNDSGKWAVALEMNHDVLKTVNPVPMIIGMISELKIPDSNREQIFTVLSELFNNALDHGVLKLDSAVKGTPEGFMQYYQEREIRLSECRSGWLKICLEHVPDCEGGLLMIRLDDSGQGFNTKDVYLGENLSSNTGFSGRGIALVQQLCERCDYNEDGTSVEVTFRWRAA